MDEFCETFRCTPSTDVLRVEELTEVSVTDEAADVDPSALENDDLDVVGVGGVLFNRVSTDIFHSVDFKLGGIDGGGWVHGLLFI